MEPIKQKLFLENVLYCCESVCLYFANKRDFFENYSPTLFYDTNEKSCIKWAEAWTKPRKKQGIIISCLPRQEPFLVLKKETIKYSNVDDITNYLKIIRTSNGQVGWICLSNTLLLKIIRY